MPPRELPAEALDADMAPEDVASGAAPPSVADADELARAQARAEAARARADRLRQEADAVSSDQDGRVGGESEPSRRRRLRRPGRKALAVTVAVLISCASLAASGYVVWQHHKVVEQRQRTAEFAAAARDGLVHMMSVDATKAREDMQRFADDTTGVFKIGFLMGAEDLVKAIEKSKISTKATVQTVAVQSMTEDSALVLVAAKAEMTKPGDAKPATRNVRAVVAIQRDAGQLKVSRVEFVP